MKLLILDFEPGTLDRPEIQGGYSMNSNEIPEIKAIMWKVEGENIIIDVAKGQLLLNDTAGIIWESINGFKSIQEIIDDMYEKYRAENSREYIEEVVNESIKLFIESDLIVLKKADEFEGWLNYE